MNTPINSDVDGLLAFEVVEAIKEFGYADYFKNIMKDKIANGMVPSEAFRDAKDAFILNEMPLIDRPMAGLVKGVVDAAFAQCDWDEAAHQLGFPVE